MWSFPFKRSDHGIVRAGPACQALGAERPSSQAMQRPPRARNQGLLDTGPLARAYLSAPGQRESENADTEAGRPTCGFFGGMPEC